MPSYFVTATGTDIGKSFVTAGLLRLAMGKGAALSALKPVSSGFDRTQPETSDAGILLAALGKAINIASLDAISPWRYTAPLAPDLAARQEGKIIPYSDVARFCRGYLRKNSSSLIEGAGGLMSPLAEGHTCLDLAQDLSLPLLLITGSYLGAISHCLTAIEAAKSRRCEIAAILVNQSPDSDLLLFFNHLRSFTGPLPLLSLSRPAKAEQWITLASHLRLC